MQNAKPEIRRRWLLAPVSAALITSWGKHSAASMVLADLCATDRRLIPSYSRTCLGLADDTLLATVLGIRQILLHSHLAINVSN